MFAKGFELYLMEGKAPSPSMRGIFYRFKEWLVAVYEGIRDSYFAGVNLTPRVKDIFDRLLATESDIEDARNEEGLLPLFEDAKAAGWTDAKAEKYARLTLENREKAANALFRREMGPFASRTRNGGKKGSKRRSRPSAPRSTSSPSTALSPSSKRGNSMTVPLSLGSRETSS
jgi:hypothetical protein